jgi:hypothetical protein
VNMDETEALRIEVERLREEYKRIAWCHGIACPTCRDRARAVLGDPEDKPTWSPVMRGSALAAMSDAWHAYDALPKRRPLARLRAWRRYRAAHLAYFVHLPDMST